MNIDELERLARAATPGPWFSDQEGRVWRRHPSELYENGGSVAGDKPMATTSRGWFHEGSTGFPSGTNADYIAAANPAAILELISINRELEVELAGLRDTIEDIRCYVESTSSDNPTIDKIRASLDKDME